MSFNTWRENLVDIGEDGPAVSNSTVPTNLLPSGRSPVLPSSYFNATGVSLIIRAQGRISTLVTTPGTLTFDVRFGTVSVLTGPAFALNTVAKTNVPWELYIKLVCRAIGTSAATVLGMGYWRSEAVVGSPLPAVGGAGTLMIPSGAPAVGAGFNSEDAQQVTLRAAWSVASPSNSITMHTCEIEMPN
jgi:hypothetical protein